MLFASVSQCLAEVSAERFERFSFAPLEGVESVSELRPGGRQLRRLGFPSVYQDLSMIREGLGLVAASLSHALADLASESAEGLGYGQLEGTVAPVKLSRKACTRPFDRVERRAALLFGRLAARHQGHQNATHEHDENGGNGQKDSGHVRFVPLAVRRTRIARSDRAVDLSPGAFDRRGRVILLSFSAPPTGGMVIRAPEVTPWTAYLDESGDFDDAEDAVAIGGLLLRDDILTLSPRALRASLEGALPSYPWPLHASLVNQLAYAALAWNDRFGSSSVTGDTPFAAAAREAVARLAVLEPEKVALLTAQFREGQRLDFPALEVLSRHLRRAYPATARAIDAGIRDAWTQVREVARQLAGLPSSPGALLVAASETQLGDAGTTADERYFGALEALLDRIMAVLRRTGGKHRVGVKALARDVYDRRIERPVRLMPQHVEQVIRRLPSEVRPPVRLIAEEVADYDGSVGVAFVLSDFFANRARRSLRQGFRGIRHTEKELANDLGLGAHSGTPVRSHLASTGEGLLLLRSFDRTAGLSPRAQLPLAPPRRRWAVEQAWEWVESV